MSFKFNLSPLPPDPSAKLNGEPEFLKNNREEWSSISRYNDGLKIVSSENNEQVYKLTLNLPTPFTVERLKDIASLAKRLAGDSVRFTYKKEIELTFNSKENLKAAQAEAQALGLDPVNWQTKANLVQSCQGLLFCHMAAVDTLGPTQALNDLLSKNQNPCPAVLNISVCGCLGHCQVDLGADILIFGRFTQPPTLDHTILNNSPKRDYLVECCPAKALKTSIVEVDGLYFNSLKLDKNECLYCGRCQTLAPGFIFETGLNRSVFSLYVGGIRSSCEGLSYPKLALDNIENSSPKWPELTSSVQQVIENWQKNARPNERLGVYINRLGWSRWLEELGWPISYKMLDNKHENPAEIANRF